VGRAGGPEFARGGLPTSGEGVAVLIRSFGWAFAATAVVLLTALALDGPEAMAVVAILSLVEVSLSFDNAVVNAAVLRRMSPFWQRMFLTVGVLVAVFGMRLLFPLLVVGVTAALTPWDALDLSIAQPHVYAAKLDAAHPAIAAFGGVFLLLIFLDFMFAEREVKWLLPIERPLARIGRLNQMSTMIVLALLAVLWYVLPDRMSGTVLIAGVLGLLTYLIVNTLGEYFESQQDDEEDEAAAEEAGRGGGSGSLALATGKAALMLFLYLEVLDASFSFDGVVGAFAISSNIFAIAAGLGVGALYVRSLTVYLVREGKLEEYVYLEHGAHYAIGALGILLLVTIAHPVSDIVTGVIGVFFIVTAFVSSVLHNRRARQRALVESGERVEQTARL
jgi:hypothetical protein